jgi:crotonobetainyl-CoA:carnitine CoA-transferase CaiB-like acyl-CoA transferase
MGSLPLADIRVIAVEQYGAGPWGSLHLADLGAEVIKIEDPATGGDIGRYVPPYAEGEDSLFFEAFNRGKRSLSLDLSAEAGRAVLGDLVAVSDAVYSNLRGDVPARVGLTYSRLRHRNPRIVCCSLSGFGMTGPRAAQPGYDYILQGLAGWMDLTGEPDGPPARSGLSLVDYAAGQVAALSLLAGVHAARRDGTGMDCDVSLFDTALAMLTYPATWHLTAGYQPCRTMRSAHPSVVPFGLFRAADGWIVVACPKEKFWRRLAAVAGHPEWADDPRFASLAARNRNRDELLALLEPALAARPAADWLADLEVAGIPCSPVNTVGQALADPQAAAREMIAEVEHPRYGSVRMPRTAARAGAARPPDRRAPRRNEDFGYVTAELLGYPAERTRELAAAGAFGDPVTVPGINDRQGQAADGL